MTHYYIDIIYPTIIYVYNTKNHNNLNMVKKTFTFYENRAIIFEIDIYILLKQNFKRQPNGDNHDR